MRESAKDIGRPCAGDPPLPIPNREVKPCSADGTGVTPGRVGRRPYPLARLYGGLFFVIFFSVQADNTGLWMVTNDITEGDFLSGYNDFHCLLIIQHEYAGNIYKMVVIIISLWLVASLL